MFSLLENHLLYYPDKYFAATPDQAGLEYEEVWFETSDGLRLHGWFLPPASNPEKTAACLLFLHGNAGNISHRLDNIKGLVGHGLAVFIFDYRGYGLSRGRPSEKGTYEDARAAYRHLLTRPGISPENVVIFGRSLGGAVAVDLAGHFPARALILESSFTSFREVARVHFPFVPSFLLSRKYESERKMASVRTPALFVHGRLDSIVPFDMGRRLFAAHPGPKEFYSIDRAGHNDTFIVGEEQYYQRLLDFIQSYPVN